jgi:hypothetical protein
VKAVILCFALLALTTYLFASAPPPLETERAGRIAIEKALAMLNAQNEEVRLYYAEQIVGAGKKQGLEFNESWKRDDVHAGPLPALFLRETAAYLEAHPTRLSLFLGSDRPINKSNGFSGTQLELFDHIRETRDYESFYSRDTDLYVAMFPDVATSESCVSCHNDHPDSPKKDWTLGDVMGAVTWSHPSSRVSTDEVIEMSDALLAGIEKTYRLVLDDLSRAPKRHQLPDAETFMKEVRARTAPRLLQSLSREVRNHGNQ